ncbi:helix-turn-helix transcriptional regulator [Janthinobacterium sp. ROICE36]|uniref:helix-turn-helix transcriptional regulator n=1 Tax=Janthinobacterium sp. ROICE36 TaxID=2048670 RepID=UPI0015E089C8
MSQRVLRISGLATTPSKSGKLPVSPATVWRWVREGKFPAPHKISAGVTVWNESDVDAWLTARTASAISS